MWNFELVALRAMKNYSIKNYLASYSMFLLDSPNLCILPFSKSLGRDGRGLFLLHLSITSLTAQTFLDKNLGALHRKPYLYITPQNALRDFSFSRVITSNYSFTSLYSSPFGEVGRGLYYRLISFALIAHWCISTFSSILLSKAIINLNFLYLLNY